VRSRAPDVDEITASLSQTPVGTIVGGFVAAVTAIGATLIALAYIHMRRATGQQHTRVRVVELDPQEMELHDSLPHRSLVIGHALPVAEAVTTVAAERATASDPQERGDETDPFPLRSVEAASASTGKALASPNDTHI